MTPQSFVALPVDPRSVAKATECNYSDVHVSSRCFALRGHKLTFCSHQLRVRRLHRDRTHRRRLHRPPRLCPGPLYAPAAGPALGPELPGAGQLPRTSSPRRELPGQRDAGAGRVGCLHLPEARRRGAGEPPTETWSRRLSPSQAPESL